MLQVESIVLKRYGKEASRIFKLLLQADRVVETEMVKYINLVTTIWMKSQLYIFFLWSDPQEICIWNMTGISITTFPVKATLYQF